MQKTKQHGNIGERINDEVLQNKRADFGEQILPTASAKKFEIVVTASRQLTEEYGSGWGGKQLRHFLKIAEAYPVVEIVPTLWRQLS